MISDQDDDDQLRCNICTECFDDAEHTPKMLVCHHTFCLHCLTQYGLNKQQIPCPTCRTPTVIGKDGVIALQDNRELQSLVHEAQLLASTVFYSDGSDDNDGEEESPANKKMSISALWCEKCLKQADPICLAVHETSYLKQGIKHLTDRVESSLENGRQIIAEHASLFQARLDNLLMTQEACSLGLAKRLEGDVNKYTQALNQIQSQMDALCLQLDSKDPSSLAQILHDTETQSKQIKEESKSMTEDLELLNDIHNSCISIQYPGNKQTRKDPRTVLFKVHELPKDHEMIMLYILQQVIQKKTAINNKSNKNPETQAQLQRTDLNWHEVRGRRQKRNSLSANSRASSQDSVNHSFSRALSVDSLASRSHKDSIPTNTVQCFFDIAVNGEPRGRVVIQLRPDVAPRMCSNFVALCTGHKGYGYKGSKIFKALPNDHIIGGDFENNDGSGGHSIYHKKRLFLADKCGLKDEVGAVRMRGMGMDESTGLGLIGSQFHIWVGKRFFRPYPRTLVIGKVVEGIELCKEISRLKSKKASNGNQVLLDNIIISSCGKL